MDRLACVEVPALPLQVLLREHPEWAGWPAAVVDADKPQGLVLYANRQAREAGVLPGHRYGPALSLAPTLRASPVGEGAIAAGVDFLIDRLHHFSPDVEPSRREPGVFWLDAGGLEHVFPSHEAWALSLRQDLASAGYIAAVVVGFGRFGTYATARALYGREAVVFETPAQEEEASRRVPLSVVGLPPSVRDELAKLGVFSVGELIRLPAHGLARRFGPEALALYRFAAGDLELPLAPKLVIEPIEERQTIEYGEGNSERLVFIVKPLVDRLLFTLRQRGEALVELRLRLTLEAAEEQLERVRTAEPTLSSVTVMELVKLRLQASPVSSPVIAIAASAEAVQATAEQLRMFAESPKRDLAAAARAFARLRAAFGREDVVARAVMRDRHTPEVSFGWEPMQAIAQPRPGPPAPMLIRRVLERPEPLWFRPDAMDGLNGPYRLVGGWWRSGVVRDYYFVELGRGELLWVYYDQARRRWFLQGEIS